MKVGELITLLQTKKSNDDVVLADFDFNNIWKKLTEQDIFITEYNNILFLHSEDMNVGNKYENRKNKIDEEITDRENKLTKLKKHKLI